jgi:hypothetical protein
MNTGGSFICGQTCQLNKFEEVKAKKKQTKGNPLFVLFPSKSS